MVKNILIVDDDNDILDVMKGYLEDESSLHIVTLNNPLHTLQTLQSNHFDLLITDILMPELNGIELITQVQEEFPHLKILACSGGGEAGSIVAGLALDQALSEGARSAIAKPFSEEEFKTRVFRLLGLS